MVHTSVKSTKHLLPKVDLGVMLGGSALGFIAISIAFVSLPLMHYDDC